jgi:hypothetical protein
VTSDRAQLQEWWDTLTEDQKARLKQAVQTYPADPSIVGLLTSANCPAKTSWTATSVANGPQAVALHDPLRAFIKGKLDECPECGQPLEPVQQGRLLGDPEVRVMVPTCPRCGWAVTQLRGE